MQREQFGFQFLLPFVLGVIFVSTSRLSAGDSVAAASSLIPESILASNGKQLAKRAQELPVSDQFDLLRSWVLPTKARGFRVRGWFTDPRVRRSESVRNSSEDVGHQLRSGDPDSVALALVRLATETGRLDELKNQIASITAKTESDRRSKSCLLALLALEGDKPGECIEHAQQLLDIVLANSTLPLQERWPEILVADRLARRLMETSGRPTSRALDRARFAIEELLLELQPKARSDGMSVESAHILRLIRELDRKRWNRSDPSTAQNSVDVLKYWSPVDRVDESSLSTGRPLGRWMVDGNQVRCTSSHYCESLYYRVPLQGNFQVEAEVSSVPYARGHLAWGGRWVAVPDKVRILTGRYWSGNERDDISPPLTDMEQWSRYRMQVKDNYVSVWFNGRLVHQHGVENNCDPWLSIRNMWMHQSGVRNVRITGDPVVPDEISLLTSDDLPGWSSFYGLNQWKQIQVQPSDKGDESEQYAELTSLRHKDIHWDAFAPSLLYYHRPMLEDGDISYQFFYQAGDSTVHPVIGDSILLLGPKDVQLHSTASIEKRDEPLESHEAALPFREGQWNEVQVSLRGDAVQFTLNGQTVHDVSLDDANRRTFGLFHFADQSSARVRSVRWRGQWPKELPGLQDQELAAAPAQCLAGLDELTETFEHDFATLGVPEQIFDVEGESVRTQVKEELRGVRVSPIADGAWRGLWLKLKEPLYGDFDAVLEFEDLQFNYGSSDYLDMEIRGVDASGQEFKATRQRHKNDNHFYSKLDQRLPNGSWTSSHKGVRDESTSGRLRLIRRGDVCHMLIAHQNSPNYHYCGSQPMLSADSVMRVEILVKHAGGGTTSALLKSLRIRSNSKAQSKLRDLRIAGLQAYLYQLRYVTSRTFALADLTGFETVGQAEFSDTGLVSKSMGDGRPGEVKWNADVKGEFDVSVSLDPKTLVPDSSAAVEFAIDEKKKIDIRLECLDDQRLRIRSEAFVGGNMPTIDAHGDKLIDLRLIRIQKTFFLVYADGGVAKLLGRYDFSDEPGKIRFFVQGDSPTSVTWVKFRSRLAQDA